MNLKRDTQMEDAPCSDQLDGSVSSMAASTFSSVSGWDAEWNRQSTSTRLG